jgi:hypothetical protein
VRKKHTYTLTNSDSEAKPVRVEPDLGGDWKFVSADGDDVTDSTNEGPYLVTVQPRDNATLTLTIQKKNQT